MITVLHHKALSSDSKVIPNDTEGRNFLFAPTLMFESIPAFGLPYKLTLTLYNLKFDDIVTS